MTIEEYKNIDIGNFLLQNGYSSSTKWAKEKSSFNYLAFENETLNDRLVVKKSINRYSDVNLSSPYRDIIDLVAKRLHTLFKHVQNEETEFLTALKILQLYQSNFPTFYTSYKPQNQIKKFNINDFIINALPKRNYLNTLGFSNEILNSDLFINKILTVHNPIYENDKIIKRSLANISFPYIIDPASPTTVGFEQINKNYKGHAIHSNKKEGVWISNVLESSKFLFITESVKDAIAHYCLYKNRNIVYCSTGGNISTEQITTINNISNHFRLKKVLGFDNDINGAAYALTFILKEINNINSLKILKINNEKCLQLKIVNSDKVLKTLNKVDSILSSNFVTNSLNSDILSIELKTSAELIQKFTKTLMSTHLSQFIEQYNIQVPKEKDFYDDFFEKKKINLEIKI